LRQRNLLTWLVGILILTIIAGTVDVISTVPVINRDVRPRLGLDLQGGLQLVLQAQSQQAGQSVTAEQLQAARNIIEDRANGLGASEPVVQTAGSDRILAELPGLEKLEDATRIIRETAFLEFVDAGTTPLTQGQLICTSRGNPRPEQVRNAEGGATAGATVTASGTVTGTTGTTGSPTPGTTPVAQETPCAQVYNTVVDGNKLDGNKVAVVYDSAGLPQVSLPLKDDGGSIMQDFTSKHIGQYMAIVLDKTVISAPVIQGAFGRNGNINNFGADYERRLATQLKYGALPVSLTLLESRKISATLGQEAIDKSIVAGIVGLGLVVLFMLFYYRLPGAVADVALVIYALIALAIFKLLPVTLTLAGIAGFILSIGMAVDANVLIFSRLKEELRSGKTLSAAVEAGFDHAWPSIRDSNVSTLMTCAILFWFGSTFGGASIIKGFALTLAIGVLVSLFSAITVTRTFLRALVGTKLAQSRWAFDLDEGGAPPSTRTATEA